MTTRIPSIRTQGTSGSGGGVIHLAPTGDTSGVRDLANLKAAHNELVANGSGTLELSPRGAFYIGSAGLDWRTHKVNLQGNNARIICTGDFLRLVATSADTQYGSESSYIQSLKIIGPGQGTATRALSMSSSVETKSPRPTLQNIHATDFGTGIYCGDRAYLAMIENVALAYCGIGFHQASGADAGENIAWKGGCIGNSGTAILLEDDTSELFCHGVSIDYCNKWADIRVGVLNLHGCHLERHSGYLNTAISVSGDGSGFVMHGGSLGLNEQPGFPAPYGFPAIIDLDGVSTRGVFRDVRMVNIRNADDRFHTGTGTCVIENPILFTSAAMPRQVGPVTGSANLATDGNVSQSTVADSWHIYSCQSGTYTSRLASGAHTISVSTDRAYSGSQSIKLARANVGAGYVGVFAMMIPLPHKAGARLLGAMRVGRTDAAVPVKVNVSFARVNRQDASIQGKFAFTRETTPNVIDVAADTTGVSSFVELGNGQTAIPTWADVLVIKIDMTYTNPNQSVYVDDLNVSVV